MSMALMKKAVAWAESLGLLHKELTQKELEIFERTFERMLVQYFPEREIREIFLRHKGEILLGCMVAKNQFEKEFDGEMPSSGKFGMIISRASFYGIGDDWEDAGPFTTGSPQNWIHSGTTLMGGTAGNAVKIGKNAVHVVIGVGSLHPSPKIESMFFEIDGKDKPILVTMPMKRSGLRVKEFDTAFILKQGTTILGKVFISAAFGSSVDDYPYLIAASFINAAQLRVHDPANVPGTVNDVILTT